MLIETHAHLDYPDFAPDFDAMSDDDIAIAYGTQQKVIELTYDPTANLT